MFWNDSFHCCRTLPVQDLNTGSCFHGCRSQALSQGDWKKQKCKNISFLNSENIFVKLVYSTSTSQGVDFFLIYFFSSFFLVFLFPLFVNICFYRLHTYTCFIPLLISSLVSPSPSITSALQYFSFLHSNCQVIKWCLSHQTAIRHGENPLASLASLLAVHTLLDEVLGKRLEDGSLDMMV
jgi:hypothetical protein